MWNFNIWTVAFFVLLAFVIWEHAPPIRREDLIDHTPVHVASFDHDDSPEQGSGRRIASSTISADERQLGGGSSSASSASESSGGGHSGAHPHDALFFMFNAIIVGTIVLHLTTLPKFRALQQTVCLFILGLVYSLIQEGLGVKNDLGVFGYSYDMWMAIDPHLLLFTMLPALLAGDAMTIDTTVARGCAKQCIYLAGPGVIFGAFTTAAFLYGYFSLVGYDWSFTLCIVSGAILAATDPVAVVGLLKELGASPTLTIQIQGESLLNDGTAIVLYTVAYNILSGKSYDVTEVMIYLVLSVGCAIFLGVVLGFIFFFWIKSANNRLDHNCGMIQTALSISCAYWAFCISEGALHWSGVLCTVTSSLVLADKMWPHIADKSSVLHIWHMIEYLGNTLIFFLAGALTGAAMVKIDPMDFVHLIVIYIACLIIRATLLFGSLPILNLLGIKGQQVLWEDVTVMWWGGLRGAVGLALAIQVSINKADGNIDEKTGLRVLFYVGGVAAMTLCVNAPTCPALVRWLGITKTPAAKQEMLYQVHTQLRPALEKACTADVVMDSMDRVIRHIEHDIDALVPNGSTSAIPSSLVLISAAEICERLDEARIMYQSVVNKGQLGILDMPNLPFEGLVDDMVEQIREHGASPLTVKATYEAFLCLVRHHYWHQIESGEFVASPGQGETLLRSVAYAFPGAGSHLCDFKYVMQNLMQSHEENATNDDKIRELLNGENAYDQMCIRTSLQARGRSRISLSSNMSRRTSGSSGMHRGMTSQLRTSRVTSALEVLPSILAKAKKNPDNKVAVFLESSPFVITISCILILNAIFIIIEQTQRKGDNYNNEAWIVVEIIFAVTFLLEFIIKFIGLKCLYFVDPWNVFDFILIILSVFGIVMEFVQAEDGKGNYEQSDVSNEARLFRLNRLFRVLRVLRLFRLAKFAAVIQAKLMHKDISFQLAEYMKTITVCRAFAIAHIKAQKDLAKFFGKEGEFANVEQMRCVLESQTEVYKAIVMAAAEAGSVHGQTLVAMKFNRDSIKASDKLRHFIHDAHHSGVISERDAETLSHSLEGHVKLQSYQMKKTASGRISINKGAPTTPIPPDVKG